MRSFGRLEESKVYLGQPVSSLLSCVMIRDDRTPLGEEDPPVHSTKNIVRNIHLRTHGQLSRSVFGTAAGDRDPLGACVPQVLPVAPESPPYR